MFSDGVMNLVEAGVVTGRKKTLLPGKLVTSFLMGSRALYRWAHDNPAIEMRPSSFTNDPFVIARNDRMMAINSALAVDLTGQVAADSVAGKMFSGIGGQVDFIRGAARSRGGKAVIALRSTAKDGQVSRIRAALEPGASVVTTRGDVHHVVTEYGSADLWGKSVRQRAVALIELAHPDFRAELLSEAKARRYVFPDQVAPRAPYPWAETHAERLRTGEEVIVRPAHLTDEEGLQQLFYRLSVESQHRRFFGLRSEFAHAEMQRMVDLDYQSRMALVATSDVGELVGLVSYEARPGEVDAEIAFTVSDDWQGKGLGSILLARMIVAGRANGLRTFSADVLAGNDAMLAVFHQSGLPLQDSVKEGIHHVVMRLD
jgi:RimJ/RimL family protein N-acetyltransferase